MSNAPPVQTLVSNVLMLENPDGHLVRLAEALRERIGSGCLIHQVGRARELLASLGSGLPYHLVVLDLGPQNEPASLAEALAGLRDRHRELPIVVASETGDV
ncbi:MAG: hypothetical protein KDD47_28230, partial [Acidobacteria bacterium]|nr:hypothetical protein [Acidobacteriota bacterium]